MKNNIFQTSTTNWKIAKYKKNCVTVYFQLYFTCYTFYIVGCNVENGYVSI